MSVKYFAHNWIQLCSNCAVLQKHPIIIVTSLPLQQRLQKLDNIFFLLETVVLSQRSNVWLFILFGLHCKHWETFGPLPLLLMIIPGYGWATMATSTIKEFLVTYLMPEKCYYELFLNFHFHGEASGWHFQPKGMEWNGNGNLIFPDADEW